ncbi:hypothetical protein LINPERPRIM_LOCUS5924 [Linum perenne]
MVVCSITCTELRTGVTGLLIAWEKGYRRVQVQLDSRCAAILVHHEEEGVHHHSTVVDQIHELMQRT